MSVLPEVVEPAAGVLGRDRGATQMVGIPVGLSETPGAIPSAAPELGQHTEEVPLDLLGWDWDRIWGLREREVL